MRKMDVVRMFNLLVEGNFKKEHEVQFYANALNKSPKTLSNLFAIFHYPAPSKLIPAKNCAGSKTLSGSSPACRPRKSLIHLALPVRRISAASSNSTPAATYLCSGAKPPKKKRIFQPVLFIQLKLYHENNVCKFIPQSLSESLVCAAGRLPANHPGRLCK